jgi:hypothetical protein
MGRRSDGRHSLIGAWSFVKKCININWLIAAMRRQTSVACALNVAGARTKHVCS